MAQKIAVVNYKGGVGKTVISVNLAATLATQTERNRVLLIDLDPQGNASSYCYKSKYDRGGNDAVDDGRHVGAFLRRDVTTLLEVAQVYCYPQEIKKAPEDGQGGITRNMVFDEKVGAEVEKIFKWVMVPNFKIVPAFEELGLEVDIDEFNYNLNVEILKNGMMDLEDKFDYIIFDCPPSLNKLTKAAILASNQVIIPVKPGQFEFLGLIALTNQLSTFEREYGHFLKRYVVMNLFRMGVNKHAIFYKVFKDKLGADMLNQIVPLAEEVTNSIGMNLPLAFSKKGTMKMEFEKLTRELIQLFDRSGEATHAQR